MKDQIEILLVEDSPTQAIEAQYFLEKHYPKVSLAHTGKEAIAILNRRKPSIVISDIIMPEMNGYELCRYIKGNEGLRDIPVILLTAVSEPSDILEGLAAGANDYIIKPYDNKHLLDKIEYFIAHPIRWEEKRDQEDMLIGFRSKQYTITVNRQQIVHLLISTYENIILQNTKLIETQNKLEELNQKLENKLTELERSQTELQMSETRFRILVQMLPDIVYRIDDKGLFTFINNAVQSLGYLPSELIGKHFSVIMSPEDAKKVGSSEVLKRYGGKLTGNKGSPKLFDERRTGERITKGLEIKLTPKGGAKTVSGIIGPLGDEIVIVEINSSGLYEYTHPLKKESKLIGTVGVARDITERKLAENSLAILNEELERKVKERTKELLTAKIDLEKTLKELNVTQQQMIQTEKLAAIGTMLAGVAHELNNPLMSILNYVQYVKSSLQDSRLVDILAKAESEVIRSSNIIKDLCSYSRQPQSELSKIRCKDAINLVVELLDLDFRSKDIKLIVAIPHDLPPVWVKPESLQQVFLNLLVNASDAMVNSPVKEVYIDGCQEGEMVRIAVRDTGPGIPTHIISRIFDPFFTTKEPGKGVGLGLTVSQNIIKSFGGELSCKSVVGQGTTFIIKLPVR